MTTHGLALSFLLATPVFGADAAAQSAKPSDFDACGPCCLYMACVARGEEVDYSSLRNEFDLRNGGETSISDLRRIAESHGLSPIAVKVGQNAVHELPSPFIAHLEGASGTANHFVLVMGVMNGQVVYVDPPTIAKLEPYAAFAKHWSGNAIAFADSPSTAARILRRLRWLSWKPYVRAGLVGSLVGALLLLVKTAFAIVATAGSSAKDHTAWSHSIARVTARKQWTVCMVGFAAAVILMWQWPKLRDVVAPLPALATPSTTVDLGILEPGARDFSFEVRNAGGGRLIIDRIVPGCGGCTLVRACDALAAGQRGLVTGTVHVKPGGGTSALDIFANDSEGVHRLYLSWYAKEPPTLVPREIRMALHSDERARRRVRVVHSGGHSLTFKGIAGGSDILDCRTNPDAGEQDFLTRQGPVGQTHSIYLELSVKAPKQPGRYAFNPALQFEQRGVKYDVPIAVRIDVVGKLRVTPPRLFLVSPSGVTDLVGRSRRVVVSSEEPRSALRVVSHPPFLRCALERLDDWNTALNITVTAVDEPPAEGLYVRLMDDSGVSVQMPVTLIYPSKSSSFDAERGSITP